MTKKGIHQGIHQTAGAQHRHHHQDHMQGVPVETGGTGEMNGYGLGQDQGSKRQPMVANQDFQAGAPVTAERPLPESRSEATNAAIVAGTKEVPNGDAPSNPWKGPDAVVNGKTFNGNDLETRTVLQKHFDYFDFDKDGLIWPQDTYHGFREIGFGVLLSIVGMVVIHLALAWPTCPYFPLPDPFFRIYTINSHRSRHGSDSGSYDSEGRFESRKFEEIFSKYDRDGKGGLTTREIWSMLHGHRVAVDPFGWVAGFLEWYATYLMIWPENGVLTKEDARATIDGSIFYKMQERNQAKRKSRKL